MRTVYAARKLRAIAAEVADAAEKGGGETVLITKGRSSF
jgi:hypothetical protein